VQHDAAGQRSGRTGRHAPHARGQQSFKLSHIFFGSFPGFPAPSYPAGRSDFFSA
jgi:hypothetical protein